MIIKNRQGLIAYYPLNESAGNTAIEHVYKMNATLSSGAYFKNKSVFLNGVNAYIKPPGLSQFSLPSFSISAQVIFNSLGVNQFLVDCSSNSSWGYGYSIRLTTANKFRFWAYDANNFIDSSGTYSSGTKYIVTATYNGTTKLQSLYVNGVLVASGSHTNSYFNSTVSYLQIGKSQLLGGAAAGLIKHIRFYNRAITPNEVKELYINANRSI